MPRLTKIEKLARDICWVENRLDHANVKDTKASFWIGLDDHARDTYRVGAAWLSYVVKELKPLRILALVDLDLPRQPKRSRR